MSTADIPLHVETCGMPAGGDVETFLLVHGYAASTYSWRHWRARLAERGHVVLVDLKGFGRAPKPADGRYGPRDLADLILRLVERDGLRNLTLVGHSLGGGVALLAALDLFDRDPSRLRRMVLVGSAAYDQRLPPFVKLAEYPRLAARILRWIGEERVVRVALAAIVHDRSMVTGEQVASYAQPMKSPGAVPALIQAARSIRPGDLDETVRRYPYLRIPVLLVWGRQDRVVPLAIGERLATELPDARLCVLDDCGHLPAEEHPAESWAVVESFLDEDPATV